MVASEHRSAVLGARGCQPANGSSRAVEAPRDVSWQPVLFSSSLLDKRAEHRWVVSQCSIRDETICGDIVIGILGGVFLDPVAPGV